MEISSDFLLHKIRGDRQNHTIILFQLKHQNILFLYYFYIFLSSNINIMSIFSLQCLYLITVNFFTLLIRFIE